MIPRDKSKVIQLRVSEELRKQTEECADANRETISEYIRKAIEMRNYGKSEVEKILPAQIDYNQKLKDMIAIYPEKKETNLDKVLSQTPKFPKQVQTFMKGGK